MVKRNGLKMGIAVEKEHKPTVNFLKHYLKSHHKFPPERQIYKHIALNHLKENKNYYVKLKRARL